MRFPQYYLAHHPEICSNVNNFNTPLTPPTLPTLAHQPIYPRQYNTQAIHAITSPTLAHPHATTPLTLARYPCKHATRDTQVGTNSTPFLKLFFCLIQEKIFLNLHLLVLYHKVLFWSHPCFQHMSMKAIQCNFLSLC